MQRKQGKEGKEGRNKTFWQISPFVPRMTHWIRKEKLPEEWNKSQNLKKEKKRKEKKRKEKKRKEKKRKETMKQSKSPKINWTAGG